MSADPTTQGSDFDGMEWVRNGIWAAEPCWTVEPDEEAIKQTVKSSLNGHPTTGPCDINFLAQGGFNKVYIVTVAEKEVIARVTLPVDPKWKTLSEDILVSDDGHLTAVVDWECISALPLWVACQVPLFLQGKASDKEPDKAQYQHDEEGNVVELFWEHLDDYELTQLRRVLLGEMEQLQPEWVRILER
ncbi:hypothetical protein BT67DRAFT_440687 [Trichocladium antarcticum]|uniref:Aminoglycoside phosphotransferase domain-containing protein n=1 Tax=Trichocladium antarcticum TaxID=1450529 RepID=A0AAN6UN38_9PEZI|nr:hypothetical protein BT67DRAFT_440687 [Trichocladium antarcticum]